MRYSLNCLFFVLILMAGLFSLVGYIIRHQETWNPAEQTEKILRELAREIGNEVYNTGTDCCKSEITIAMIDEYLEKSQYESLRRIRILDFDLKHDEVAWFAPNSKYSLGLRKDGQILWKVNGINATNNR